MLPSWATVSEPTVFETETQAIDSSPPLTDIPCHVPINHFQGYRFAMPHSILMMHHPSGGSRGQASEMHIEARELVRIRDYLSLLVSNSTGQPYDRVIRELSRNKWMDPKQAIEYGMIDKVSMCSTYC